MRFRNFARFDLFSSFHIRVNCWSLSSAILTTASTLDENAGQGRTGRLGSSRELEDVRREEPRAHKAFLRTLRAWPASIRERNDEIATDRFDPVCGARSTAQPGPSRLDPGAGGGVDDSRRTMPSTPWM